MINKEIVRHVAELARLKLSEKEIEKYSEQFEQILKAFKILDEVDTEDVEPSFHPLEIKNVFREDEVESGLSQEKALLNTEHKEKGYFKGPRIV